MSIQTIICKLWNFKTLTVDIPIYCADEFESAEFLTYIKEQISQKIEKELLKGSREIPCDMFRLVQGGKDLSRAENLKIEETLHVELRGSLKGGKGGFGSLLRSVKPKAQQDDNFEACRDLSGRRLRHINNERRIHEFHQRQEEEEKYVQEELKEYEQNKKQLKGAIQANNYKLDESYVKQVAQSGQEMIESVKHGAQNNQTGQQIEANSMGCADKRQKKKKPLFSLQELLCKDVESLSNPKEK